MINYILDKLFPNRHKKVIKKVKASRTHAGIRMSDSYVFSAKSSLKLSRELAEKYEWKEIAFQERNKLISFSKKIGKDKTVCRVNFYYSTWTVGTSLLHPIKGKTQLFRKNLDKETLEKIFKNPRVHTNKGYYQKNNK